MLARRMEFPRGGDDPLCFGSTQGWPGGSRKQNTRDSMRTKDAPTQTVFDTGLRSTLGRELPSFRGEPPSARQRDMEHALGPSSARDPVAERRDQRLCAQIEHRLFGVDNLWRTHQHISPIHHDQPFGQGKLRELNQKLTALTAEMRPLLSGSMRTNFAYQERLRERHHRYTTPEMHQLGIM